MHRGVNLKETSFAKSLGWMLAVTGAPRRSQDHAAPREQCSTSLHKEQRHCSLGQQAGGLVEGSTLPHLAPSHKQLVQQGTGGSPEALQEGL